MALASGLRRLEHVLVQADAVLVGESGGGRLQPQFALVQLGFVGVERGLACPRQHTGAEEGLLHVGRHLVLDGDLRHKGKVNHKIICRINSIVLSD